MPVVKETYLINVDTATSPMNKNNEENSFTFDKNSANVHSTALITDRDLAINNISSTIDEISNDHKRIVS